MPVSVGSTGLHVCSGKGEGGRQERGRLIEDWEDVHKREVSRREETSWVPVGYAAASHISQAHAAMASRDDRGQND